MQRILSQRLAAYLGEAVTLAGWVHRRRVLKNIAFLILRDRAGLAQIVVAEPAARARLDELPEETVVRVTGRVSANPDAPGGLEIVGPTIETLGEPSAHPPFDLYRPQLTAGLPTQLDQAAVALRHPRRRAAFAVGAAAVAGFRSTLDSLGFTEVHTPKLVATATESGASVFRLDYFGRPAYLAQSPQFYKQTLVGVFERVYEVGPVFRAEPSDTVRHLTQYTSLDAELGFITDHTDVMAVVRSTVDGMLAVIADRAGPALSLVDARRSTVPPVIPQIHFTEALVRLGSAFRTDLSAEPDLAPAHERWLGDWARREYDSDFLFVVGYPMVKRPFYTHPDPDRPGASNSFDLLYRGTEIATGGQRLHRHRDYLAALAARGETAEPYRSYLDTFRYGLPPHGGFALGLERFVAQLTGAANVREVCLFPRDRQRLTP